MNKLEKLFKPLIYHVVNGNNTKTTIEKQCAVVTKDITFKFLDWIETNADIIINQHSKEIKYFIKDDFKTKEQLFNIFLLSL